MNKLLLERLNHLILVIRTKIRKFKWDHTGNIFNHLASQWLIQNLPVTEKISSFETFTNSLPFYKPFNMTNELYELYLTNFYKSALSIWIQLKKPSLDDVQLAVLEIVAKAINANMRLERETFAQALYDILLVLINRKNEIITEDNFVKLMKNYLGILWKEQPNYYKACSEYYEFAKHFILIDFPNKKHSYFKNFHAILQGKIAYLNDHILTILEKQIHIAYNRVIYKKKDVDEDDIMELEPENNDNEKKNKPIDFQKYLSELILANSNFTRTKVLLTKFFKISETLSMDYFTSLKKYEIVNTLNRIIDQTGIYNILNYSLENIKYIGFGVMSPVISKTQVYVFSVRNSILIKFENLKNIDLKNLIRKLKNQIEFLRESMLIFYEGLIEVRLDKFSLENIIHKLRNDIVKLYDEINQCTLDEMNDKKESKSSILYKSAITFFQRKKNGIVNGKKFLLKSSKVSVKNEDEKNLKPIEEIQEESREITKEEISA